MVRAAPALVAWAERQGLANGQWLGYQWDNPEITSLEDCRYHVAVEAERFTPEGRSRPVQVPADGRGEVEIRGGIDLEPRALQWLYGSWLPRSGYVPDDHPCFEAWIGRPFAHGTEYFELHVQLPIRRPRLAGRYGLLATPRCGRICPGSSGAEFPCEVHRDPLILLRSQDRYWLPSVRCWRQTGQTVPGVWLIPEKSQGGRKLSLTRPRRNRSAFPAGNAGASG